MFGAGEVLHPEVSINDATPKDVETVIPYDAEPIDQPDGMTLTEGLTAMGNLLLALVDEKTNDRPVIIAYKPASIEELAEKVRQFVRERQ